MKLSISMTRREKLWGFAYLILQLFFLPSLLLLISDNLSVPLTEGQLNLLFFAVNFLCVAIIFHQFLWKNLLTMKGRLHQILLYAIWGFLLYYGGNLLVSSLIVYLDPGFSNVNDASVAQLTQQNPLLMTIGTVFLVPVAEETLYRGLLFGSLRRTSRFLAYTLSTAFFASIHVMGYIGLYEPFTLLLCFIQYLPAGIFLGWAYEKSGTIWCPILIHMTVNQIGMLAMR